MNIENLIKETFTAHEPDAPDGDEVLAAARRRIDRRPSVPGRPLAVAAGVVALTLAAVTAVALSRSGSTPTGKSDVAAPPEKTEQAIADLPMPFSLGWLPPGKVDYVARRINIGSFTDDLDKPVYGGEYMLSVTANGQVLDIGVQEFRMTPVDEAAFKSGPGNPVTINGQRGVESAPGGDWGYELYVAHPEGGSMYVDVAAQPGSTAPVQRLVDVGRRVAQNIQFPGTTTVTPDFGLRTPLPDGMQVCAFDVEQQGPSLGKQSEHLTYYSLGTCTTDPPIEVGTSDMQGPTGKPGRPVQGHATRYLDKDGQRTLRVLDAVNGDPIAVSGRVPQADLYEIADHLIMPR
jgi:hypothetical protein